MAFIQKRVSESNTGFGAELQNLRELRGLTRNDVWRLTGIHPLLLTLFEEERFGELADPAYDERHVIRLIVALEGKVPFFVTKYRAAVRAIGTQSSQNVLLHPCVRKRDFLVFSRTPVVIGVLMILFFIGGFVSWHVLEVSEPPALLITSPKEGDHITSSIVKIIGQTEPTAMMLVNGERILVGEDGAFETELDIPSGLNTFTFEAKRRQGQTTTIERHVISERRIEQAALLPDVVSH
ncbi:helix-turn-helix domain-containing protein [Candidatus Uhrbacteria bacterium]|nr:helix-turn-helix domain-containing protein [Candidatus Uhrbacteria bacterium]